MEVYGEKPKRFTSAWFEYVWEYYKIHIIVTLLVIIAVVYTWIAISSATKYDFYLCIAGDKYITDENKEDLKEVLKDKITDINGDGEINIEILDYSTSSEIKDKLRVVAKKMSNVVIECSDEDRRYIHMNAVYVSNFVNVMLQIGEKLLKEKSLDISILEPLVRETVNKAFSMGAEKALTGPARRGDKETINKHLDLLKDNNEEKEIYKLLTNYIINKYLEK